MKNFKILTAIGALILLPACLWAGSETSPANDYRKGLDLYNQGRYEAALVRFQLAIDGDWNFWQSYQMVGYCYFELRDKESAMGAFEESLKINPDNSQLLKIVGDLKAGKLDIPLRPVEVEASAPSGPVYLQAYYSFNK